jgi:hypothetical protein
LKLDSFKTGTVLLAGLFMWAANFLLISWASMSWAKSETVG